MPALAILGIATLARAGGFEIGDQGPRAAGRAGAFTVRADDPSAIDFNPAGLARLRGTRLFLADRLMFSNEEFRRARTLDWSDAVHGMPRFVSFPAVRNATRTQWKGPFLAASTDFGLSDWGFAIGVYGPAGTIGQDFPLDGPQKYMLVDRQVEILYYTASVAWKYRDVFGIGASLQWVDLLSIRFDLVIDGNASPRLVKPAGGRFDVLSRMRGSDRVGFTSIVGVWYRPIRGLEFAAAARILPVWFHAASRLSVQPLNLKLDEPPEITRDGVPDNKVTFSFVIPPRLRVGARYVFERGDRELGDIELDLGYEAWSMLKQFTLDGEGLVTTVLGQRVPIGVIKVPRHWKDTWSARLGGDFHVVPDHLTLRAGFFYESAASDPAYTYIDLLAFHRFGPSAGFSFDWAGFDLSAAYTYVFQMPVVVSESESRQYQQAPGSPCKPPYTDPNMCNSHYFGMPAAPSNAGVYLSDYHLLSVGVQYRF
jgi:long-chain fatty acid transport protein